MNPRFITSRPGFIKIGTCKLGEPLNIDLLFGLVIIFLFLFTTSVRQCRLVITASDNRQLILYLPQNEFLFYTVMVTTVWADEFFKLQILSRICY